MSDHDSILTNARFILRKGETIEGEPAAVFLSDAILHDSEEILEDSIRKICSRLSTEYVITIRRKASDDC